MSRKKTYSELDKIQAAAAYVATGSSDKAGEMINIPGRTIRTWTKEDWWPSALAQAREDMSDELDGKYTEVVHKAVLELIDRIENGDEIINPKTGEAYRRKLSARDLSIVSGIAFDKRQLIRAQPTSIDQRQVSDALGLLAERLGEAAPKERAGTTIDAGEIGDLKQK